MAHFIALLRGINVSGSKTIIMSDLRSLCANLGWEDVRTYIQSGNIVFRADGAAAALEAMLEQAIERELKLAVPTLVRGTADWRRYGRENPFGDIAEREPNRVMLALSKRQPTVDAAERLQQRAQDGERVIQTSDALWIHYAGGAGRSKLSPAVLDRLVGSPVTARNWRTVLKLGEMVADE